jgi:hypothetical protein
MTCYLIIYWNDDDSEILIPSPLNSNYYAGIAEAIHARAFRRVKITLLGGH